MNSFKLSLFDLLAYTLPGLLILGCVIILLNESITCLNDFMKLTDSLGVGKITFSIIISYIIGFAIDSPSYAVYKKIWCRIGRNPEKDAKTKYNFDEDELQSMQVIIRDKSSENSALLQTWQVLRTMSQNLAFTCLIIGIVISIKTKFFLSSTSFDWFFLFSICVLFCIIFIRRAKLFEFWYFEDLYYATRALKLMNFKNSIRETKVKRSKDIVK